MIRSMTGFAERSFSSSSLSVKITLRSLNHRYFDWLFRGNQIKELESRLRAFSQTRINRGRLEVFIDISFLDAAKWEIMINEGLLEKITASLTRISKRSAQAVSFPVENLFNIPHLVHMTTKDLTAQEKSFIEACFGKTLDDLLRARQGEGAALKKEIRGQMKTAGRIVARLKKLAVGQPGLIRKKLQARLSELGHDAAVSEQKLVEETAYMAQRYDLTEEIARLKCHIAYVRQLLGPDSKDPVGRKLDFVAQELYREVNTVSSKSQDIAITRECLDLKAEIESFRQQVQNIE